MTAIACLRVDVSGHEGLMPMSALAPLVHKFASAYLETRWLWPRRFLPLTDISFLLTDPRQDEMDVAELRRLSDELQRHLFGASDDGEVALLVFEGSHAAVTAFAALDAAAVAAAMADPGLLPEGGRLTRILPAVREGDGRPPGREAVAWSAIPAPDRAAPAPDQPPPAVAWEGAQGIYFIPRQTFFADVICFIPAGGKSHLTLVDGAEHMPKDALAYDTACLRIATRFLAQRGKGSPIYIPVSFSNLVRPSLRGAYEALLVELPPDRRSELAVSVYDVPRDPAFTALRQVRTLLDPHVAMIDLGISDPGFEIEKLPSGAATSVTFTLPEGDVHVRLSAMRRFAERLAHYKQRRIWLAITNVRRRQELEAAQRLHIPFVTGPAVCAPNPAPVGGRVLSLDRMPMTLARWMGADHGEALRTAV